MKIMMVVVLYVGASFHLFFWSWMFSECGKFMVVVVLYVRASSHLFFWYGARVRGAGAVCVQCARTVRVQCMRTGHTYGVYARDIHPQRVPEERASPCYHVPPPPRLAVQGVGAALLGIPAISLAYSFGHEMFMMVVLLYAGDLGSYSFCSWNCLVGGGVVCRGPRYLLFLVLTWSCA